MTVFRGNLTFPVFWGRMACVLLACGFLWACGDLSPGGVSDGPGSGKTRTEGTETAKGEARIAPMKMPPGFDDRPPLPGETGRERDSKGFPVMKPALGVKTQTMLFSEKIRDSNDRFERLENAVQEMRNDYDAMLPSILRLVAIEKDINQLVVQLDGLLKSDPQALSAPPAAASPVSVVEKEKLPDGPAAVQMAAAGSPAVDTLSGPLAEKDDGAPKPPAVPPPTPPPVSIPASPSAPAPIATPAAPPPAAAASDVTATGPRFGAHQGYTRIVFDVSAATAFTAEVDEAEKILLVEMPDAGWNGPASGAPAHPLIQSWNVSAGPGGKGSLISFQLSRAAKIKGRMALQSPPRIVVDLQD